MGRIHATCTHRQHLNGAAAHRPELNAAALAHPLNVVARRADARGRASVIVPENRYDMDAGAPVRPAQWLRRLARRIIAGVALGAVAACIIAAGVGLLEEP